jgi:hypothetical protein
MKIFFFSYPLYLNLTYHSLRNSYIVLVNIYIKIDKPSKKGMTIPKTTYFYCIIKCLLFLKIIIF